MSLSLLNAMSPFVVLDVMASTMPRELNGKSLSGYYKSRIENGTLSWEADEILRAYFKNTFQPQVQSTLRKYAPNCTTSKVLELGAGILNNEQTALSSCFPEAEFIFSDLSKKAVDTAKEKNPSCSYHQVDSTKLTTLFPPESMDLIVGSCFLDALPAEDLLKTLENVLAVLKEGGIFFHTNDRAPFLNTLVINKLNEEGIMFPLMSASEGIQGIQFVPTSEIKNFIQNNPNNEASNFLKNYLSISPDARGAVVIEISSFDHGKYLSDWVVKNFPQQCRIILNEKFAYERIEKVLRELGFQILQFGLTVSQQIENTSSADGFNDVRLRLGVVNKRHEKQISPGKVRKILQMHQIVVKKPIS